MPMNARLLRPTATGYQYKALRQGLVAYWPLNESVAAGNILAIDETGRGNHLASNSSVLSATGKIGQAREFIAANNNYLTAGGANTDLKFADGRDWTLAGWIFVPTWTAGLIFVANDSDGDREIVFDLRVSWTRSLGCEISPNAAASATAIAGDTLALNTWHFWCWTYTYSTGVLAGRVNDGAGNNSSSATKPAGALLQSTQPLNLGRRQYTGANAHFDGLLDEVAKWDRVLSSSELDTLYNNGAGINLAAPRPALSPFAAVSNAEAQDWLNRVYANGGTVSTSTASAVSTFCDAIESAGIRDRFARLNLFCGSSLNAALVPLFRTWRVYSGRNLLAVGDNLSASAWTKSGATVTQSSSERPFAYGPYANVVTATAGTSVTPYVVASGVTGYGTVTYSAYLKANGQNTVRILPIATAGQTFPGGGTVAYANIDLSTGAISNVLAGTTATATNAGNGWWRLAYTVTNNGTGQSALRFDIGTGNTYNAAGTESVLFWGLQNELGSTATDFDPYPLGNATDTNNGPFVSGDYVETGASGGLTGASGKNLSTGVQPLASGSPIAAFGFNALLAITRPAGRATVIGVIDTNAFARIQLNEAAQVWGGWNRGSTIENVNGGVGTSPALFVLGRRTGNVDYLNVDGADVTTAASTAADNTTAVATLFDSQTLRAGAYAIGGDVTESQLLSFYNALRTFQNALGRNV